jgi:hypothetical protein
MIFTSEKVEIEDTDAPPITALKLKQVKEFIRQKAKERKLSAPTISAVNAALQPEELPAAK